MAMSPASTWRCVRWTVCDEGRSVVMGGPEMKLGGQMIVHTAIARNRGSESRT